MDTDNRIDINNATYGSEHGITHRVALTRRDIMIFEAHLKQAVHEFFPFQGWGLHFPRTTNAMQASVHVKEDKVLLPLPDLSCADVGGYFCTLAVITLRGVSQKVIKTLLPEWPALAKLIAQNLLLYKQSLSDPVTCLFSRHYLFALMERELEGLRLSSALVRGVSTDERRGDLRGIVAKKDGLPASEDALLGANLHLGHVGIGRSGLAALVVRFASLRDVIREFGYLFADDLMRSLANVLSSLCPEGSIAARIGDSEFAVYLPSAMATECQKLALEITRSLRAVCLVHPLRKERVSIIPSVGFAIYPQDMSGDIFLRPAADQARLLLRKARLAAALAGEEYAFPGSGQTIEPVMAFGRILAEGGRILEILPLSRVIVSLGENMRAREGLRFSVWSFAASKDAGQETVSTNRYRVPLYKGEIVLMDVQENTSQAEVVSLGDPSWQMETGDRLVLLPEEQGSLAKAEDDKERRDPVTGFLRHSDFFARWAEAREASDIFSLALLHIVPAAADFSSYDSVTIDPLMAQVAGLCQEEFGTKILGGRYGLNSLVFFHAQKAPEDLFLIYEKLVILLEKRLGLQAAVGLSGYPYLEFRKADIPENCRKALEYALLLPVPHVGILDTLALNISADKRFSQGDTFGAIKEYQTALMADSLNGMAWNSLGICFASLGKSVEAEEFFVKALSCDATNAMSLYNLGYMHHSQGQDIKAKQCYEECLKFDPAHMFAHIRLGYLAESKGHKDEARRLYEKAAALPGGKSLTYRHFARLALHAGDEDAAREYLHEALLYDPYDAKALQLLARLYLDSGEDPEMAASLARQSVTLRPDLKAGWIELARALSSMGQDSQAREARLRAGEL